MTTDTTGADELRDRIAALFRHQPGAERLGDATPGEISDAVLAALPAPALVVARRVLGTTAQPDTMTAPVVTLHAIPVPGSNGISSCCGRPPCEFVGERLTRDPALVTCPGAATPAL